MLFFFAVGLLAPNWEAFLHSITYVGYLTEGFDDRARDDIKSVEGP